MVREMEEQGYIQTVKNQFDARAKLLSITTEGKKGIKAIEAELYGELSGLLTGLTEEDLITYHKVLKTIISNSLTRN
jgi:DNA-binding MarR family transcriptional regulator